MPDQFVRRAKRNRKIQNEHISDEATRLAFDQVNRRFADLEKRLDSFGYVESNPTSNFYFVDSLTFVTPLILSIDSYGSPILVGLKFVDGVVDSEATMLLQANTGNVARIYLNFLRDDENLMFKEHAVELPASTSTLSLLPNMFFVLDSSPPPGIRTYSLKASATASPAGALFDNVQLYALRIGR